MSFPSLPVDLYDEITSHLVGNHARGKVRPIALGKALSLVCKPLRPVGQALIWRHITLDDQGPPESILANLDSRTHLHPFVKSITARVGHDESPEDSEATTLTVLKMIQVCQMLHRISIALPHETESSVVRQVFEAASRLEHLHVLAIAGAPVEINPATIELLHLGFPCLCTLDICFDIPGGGTEALESTKPSGTRSACGLRRLNLDVVKLHSNSMQIPKILCLLASSFGAADLVEYNFTGPFFHRLTFQWLTFRKVRVREISFNHCELSELDDEFVDFVHYLPEFGRLSLLYINSCMTDDDHHEHSTKAPVSLIKLLSSVPSSIHLLQLKGVYFYGSLSFVETRLKPSALALIEGPSVQLYPKTLSAQTFVTLKKMKDKKGISRWHRVVEVSTPSLPSVSVEATLTLPLWFRRPETSLPVLAPSSFPLIPPSTLYCLYMPRMDHTKEALLELKRTNFTNEFSLTSQLRRLLERHFESSVLSTSITAGFSESEVLPNRRADDTGRSPG